VLSYIKQQLSSSDKTKIKGVFENKVLTGNKMEPII
jgi:hypothetical protein